MNAIISSAYDIQPVCDWGRVDANTGHSTHIVSEHIKVKEIPKTTKRVYVVSLGQDASSNAEVELLLRKCGKKTCDDGPNYLLGLLSEFSIKDLPEPLAFRGIVASGSRNLVRCTFPFYHSPGYLYATIAVNGHRSFGICGEPPQDIWPGKYWYRRHWLFLAEDL